MTVSNPESGSDTSRDIELEEKLIYPLAATKGTVVLSEDTDPIRGDDVGKIRGVATRHTFNKYDLFCKLETYLQ